MSRSAKYSTATVVAHLLVNIVHGLAHRELHVGLAPLASIFVIVVVLIFPLIAMALIWTTAKRLGFILLSLSMFGSFLLGLYYHFLAVSPDHIHSQPSGGWGYHLCPDRVYIAHHGSGWNLRRRSFSLDCSKDFEQSRQNLKAAASARAAQGR